MGKPRDGYWKERYALRRAAAIKFLGGRCVECGAVVALEIHHRDPSEKEFSFDRLYNLSEERFYAELRKCELRCDACHTDTHRQKEHGTAMYRRGCRCEVCRTSTRLYMREYRLRKRGRVRLNAPVC